MNSLKQFIARHGSTRRPSRTARRHLREEPRSCPSTRTSWACIAHARQAGGWRRFQASGPIGATALVAKIGDWKTFSSGRNLAAWIGLVPKQHTTGGKDRLGSITIRYAQKHGTKNRPWLGRLMERRPTKVAAVALANKIARMAWASWPSPLSLRRR